METEGGRENKRGGREKGDSEIGMEVAREREGEKAMERVKRVTEGQSERGRERWGVQWVDWQIYNHCLQMPIVKLLLL